VKEDLFDLERVSRAQTYCDLIIGHRAPFLTSCGGVLPCLSFIWSSTRFVEESALQKRGSDI
jgi:hypothetical protein